MIQACASVRMDTKTSNTRFCTEAHACCLIRKHVPCMGGRRNYDLKKGATETAWSAAFPACPVFLDQILQIGSSGFTFHTATPSPAKGCLWRAEHARHFGERTSEHGKPLLRSGGPSALSYLCAFLWVCHPPWPHACVCPTQTVTDHRHACISSQPIV